MGAKVFIRGGTSDNSKKKTQIEALSRRGIGIIHSANLKASLSGSPNVCVSLCQTILLGKF
jgi:hypothetical protein